MKRIMGTAILLMIFSSSLTAQHSDWKIRTTDKRIIENVTLIGLEQDSLIVSSETFSGKMDVGSIERLQRGNSNVFSGLGVGFVTGGAVGYFLGSKSEDNTSTYAPYSSSSYDTDKKVSSMFIGAAIGGAFGGLVGLVTGREVAKLEGKTSDERIAVLKAVLVKEGRVIKQIDRRKQEDVVYLKTGPVIRGTVVEMIPDSTVRIQTFDGSLFVFQTNEVERISKEDGGNVAPAAAQNRTMSYTPGERPIIKPFSVMIAAGAGFPVGAFGAKSGETPGLAGIGFTAGADIGFRFSSAADVLVSIYYSSNSVDESSLGLPSQVSAQSGSWSSFWPMIGIRVRTPNPIDVAFFGIGQIGLLAGSSPEVTASYLGASVSQISSSASSIAFSFGFGVIARDRFTLSTRYFYGNPEYELSASSGSYTVHAKAQQPTSLIFVGFGVIF